MLISRIQLLKPLTKRLLHRQLSSKVIGIDLGTTNSAVAYIRDFNDKKSSVIIENDMGERTTPSVVAFTIQNRARGNSSKRQSKGSSSDIIVGTRAKRQQLINPENTFFATKRLIGRTFSDEEVKHDIKLLPYKIVKNPHTEQAAVVTTDGQIKSPGEISSILLRYLKKTAEDYLNEQVKLAVITVPAYFNDAQRQATKDAGKLAGLNVLRVVNEPTAAALSFGLDTMKNKEDRNLVAVYDLGGGTFDISILDIEDGVFEVRSTNGDTHLGGEDFDNVIVNYFIEQFISQNKDMHIVREEIIKDRELMQRLKENAERVKIELSHTKDTVVEIPFLYKNYHLKLSMKEEELDQMTQHLIDKTIPPVKRALKDADIEPQDIDEVIMVGGMTRMPRIRHTVKELFGGKTPNTSVNPDETVAIGAAIQGGILSGEIKNVLLLDVTPLTLGIETFGGTFSPLIPRNTTVPVKKTEIFSTGVDNQTGVDIKVYQGERGLVRDNKLIGDLKLSGIPPMPKGTPQIAVTFDIDADGIINVSASERSSGQEKSITVIANTGLTEEEIQRRVDEANANREQDNLIRQRMELMTKADIMVSDAEKSFKQFKKLISIDPEYKKLNKEVQYLRDQITRFKKDENNTLIDVNDVKKRTDKLQGNVFKLFQRVTNK
ncbi:Hsp70 family ATPase SSQ1 PWA37_002644 [Arxiozyma heterogenica]|uniref:Hsp70 family ATPase SSQ1 n=1 Tax=Arxiozyma heterogenica TaxID=278026 RepID=UPI002EF4D38C